MDYSVIQYSVTDQALAELAERYAKIPDFNTKEGYEEGRQGIATTRQFRSAVEQKRKELKADSLEFGRRVDIEAKRIIEALKNIEKPMKDAKQIVDDRTKREREEKKQAEARRKEKIVFAINEIRNVRFTCGESSKEIKEAIDGLNEIEIGEEYQEFIEDAKEAHKETIDILRDLFIAAGNREEEEAKQAEERLRLEAEKKAFGEQQRKEAEEREKREAVERVARQAEEEKLAKERAKLEEEQAELRKQQEEIAAKEEAERVARAKVEHDAAEEKRIEEEKKANIELQSKQKAEAASALTNYMSKGDAIIIIELIQDGSVPHVRWMP